jgi:hypothetical protein
MQAIQKNTQQFEIRATFKWLVGKVEGWHNWVQECLEFSAE